jgi:hypothetical protein
VTARGAVEVRVKIHELKIYFSLYIVSCSVCNFSLTRLQLPRTRSAGSIPADIYHPDRKKKSLCAKFVGNYM